MEKSFLEQKLNPVKSILKFQNNDRAAIDAVSSRAGSDGGFERGRDEDDDDDDDQVQRVRRRRGGHQIGRQIQVRYTRTVTV